MLAVLQRTPAAEGELDTMLVVPANIRVYFPHELFKRRIEPVTMVVHLVFQPSEEALAGCIIRRAALARHGAGVMTH